MSKMEQSLRSAMNENQILAAMASASPDQQVVLRKRLASLRAQGSVERGPVIPTGGVGSGEHLRHTAATDWLDRVAMTPAGDVSLLASAEATKWLGTKSALVLSNPQELRIQAEGYATHWAGQYGVSAPRARLAFMASLRRLAGDQTDEAMDSPVEEYDDFFDEDRRARVRYEKTVTSELSTTDTGSLDDLDMTSGDSVGPAVMAARRTAAYMEGVDCPMSEGGWIDDSVAASGMVMCPECHQAVPISFSKEMPREQYAPRQFVIYPMVHLLPGKTLNDRLGSRRTAAAGDVEQTTNGKGETKWIVWETANSQAGYFDSAEDASAYYADFAHGNQFTMPAPGTVSDGWTMGQPWQPSPGIPRPTGSLKTGASAAYNKGFNAGITGDGIGYNPYPMFDDKADEWIRGYRDAQGLAPGERADSKRRSSKTARASVRTAGQSVYRFTMSPANGSAEDLRIMLRDGVDALAEGSGEHEGNPYFWVEYAMDEETAGQWYDAYPFLGMQRMGSVRRASKTAAFYVVEPNNADVMAGPFATEEEAEADIAMNAPGQGFYVEESDGLEVEGKRRTAAATIVEDDTESHWAGTKGGADYIPMRFLIKSKDGTVLGAYPTRERAEEEMDLYRWVDTRHSSLRTAMPLVSPDYQKGYADGLKAVWPGGGQNAVGWDESMNGNGDYSDGFNAATDFRQSRGEFSGSHGVTIGGDFVAFDNPDDFLSTFLSSRRTAGDYDADGNIKCVNCGQGIDWSETTGGGGRWFHLNGGGDWCKVPGNYMANPPQRFASRTAADENAQSGEGVSTLPEVVEPDDNTDTFGIGWIEDDQSNDDLKYELSKDAGFDLWGGI